MKMIDDIVNEYEDFREVFDYKKNCCLDTFYEIMGEGNINDDMYSTAKAFTSILNQIVNRKIEYGNFIIAGQIELLTFLNTFDDNYLSSIKNLLECQNSNEQLFITDIDEDICNIISFLEYFLKKLKNNDMYSEPNSDNELKKLLDELNKRNKRGDM